MFLVRGLHRFLLITLTLIATTALSACERTTTWRQRLTLVVETPAGDVSASSVTEVTAVETRGGWVVPDARGVRATVTGEAVALEVAPGRWLFALLSGSNDWQRDATHWVHSAYRLADAGSHAAQMGSVTSQPRDTPVPMPPEGWPKMVTFADITDPASVEHADPADLTAIFGPGVRLKAVTLEITEAAVTEGQVEEALGPEFFQKWARIYKDALADKAKASVFKTLAGDLARNNFIQEKLP